MEGERIRQVSGNLVEEMDLLAIPNDDPAGKRVEVPLMKTLVPGVLGFVDEHATWTKAWASPGRSCW